MDISTSAVVAWSEVSSTSVVVAWSEVSSTSVVVAWSEDSTNSVVVAWSEDSTNSVVAAAWSEPFHVDRSTGFSSSKQPGPKTVVLQ